MAFAMKTHDTEVPAKSRRRRFTAEYKQRILREVGRCTKPGEVGALLRREGLYSSHLAAWRAARSQGERAGLELKRRGTKPRNRDGQAERVAELEREVHRWKGRAERAELLVDLQKKVSQILGIELDEKSEKP
jgi:transposase